MTDHGLGAQQSPPELLAQAWPIGLALAAAPMAAPLKFHSPRCDVHATLNQNGYGACVCASGDYVQSGIDAIDPAHLAWLRMYAILKGLPYPFTPAQDASPGLYPIQLWTYAKANGWPASDGSAPHKDASYFMIGKPSSSAAFLDALQQTILQLGPCQFTSTWPNNWWNTDYRGFMPTPLGNAGGHAFECCGWEVHPGGSFDTFHHQTWGTWGHDPEFPNHFRVHSTAWDSLGWEAWKVAELITPVTPPRSAVNYTAIPPVRVLNTRSNVGLSGAFASLTPRKVKLAGVAGIPANAVAINGNLTVTQQSAAGYLEVGPDAIANPTTSSLNFPTADIRANALAGTALNVDGTLAIIYVASARATTHVVLDVNGYFTP